MHKAMHLLRRVYQDTIFRKKVTHAIFIKCTLMDLVYFIFSLFTARPTISKSKFSFRIKPF